MVSEQVDRLLHGKDEWWFIFFISLCVQHGMMPLSAEREAPFANLCRDLQLGSCICICKICKLYFFVSFVLLLV